MKTTTERLCIYPKDIARVTGRSERYSRELYHRIRLLLGKKAYQFVTVEEFCEYAGLNPEKVMARIDR